MSPAETFRPSSGFGAFAAEPFMTPFNCCGCIRLRLPLELGVVVVLWGRLIKQTKTKLLFVLREKDRCSDILYRTVNRHAKVAYS
jgi:hypothetical protein